MENVAPEDFDAETRLSAEKGYGIARVREALQAHMWPGLKMKGILILYLGQELSVVFSLGFWGEDNFIDDELKNTQRMNRTRRNC